MVVFAYDKEVEEFPQHFEDRLLVSNNRLFVLQATHPDLYAFIDDLRWPTPASDNWMHDRGCFFMIQDVQNGEMARSIDGTMVHKRRKYSPDGSLLNILQAFDSTFILSIRDFCVPHKDIWVRRLKVRSTSGREKKIRLILFIAPRTGNEKRILEGQRLENDAFIFNGSKGAPYVAVASDKEVRRYLLSKQAYQKAFVGTFKEEAQTEEANRVELALAIDLNLGPGETELVNFSISLGTTREEALRYLNRDAREPDAFYLHTRKWWEEWFKKGTVFRSSCPKLNWLYQVNLMVSKMCQAQNGAVPYTGCGDYDGMTWVRDNVWYAMGMDYAGHFEEAQKALDWCLSLERRENGSFYTNYLVDPHTPKWTQIEHDFMGEILTGIWVHYLFTQDKSFLSERWEAIREYAGIILQNISGNGLIDDDFSIWEDNPSQNTFTSGVCAFGLWCASQMAKVLGEPYLSQQWEHSSKTVVEALQDLCYSQELECLTESPNSAFIDGSVLALFSWFPLFRGKHKFDKCIDRICSRLWHKEIGGLRRREKELCNPKQDWDKFPWPGVTLWAADALLERDDPWALKFLDWVIQKAMPEGILAENVHSTSFSRFPMPSYSSMGLIRTLLCLADLRFDGFVKQKGPVLNTRYGEIRLENLPPHLRENA